MLLRHVVALSLSSVFFVGCQQGCQGPLGPSGVTGGTKDILYCESFDTNTWSTQSTTDTTYYISYPKGLRIEDAGNPVSVSSTPVTFNSSKDLYFEFGVTPNISTSHQINLNTVGGTAVQLQVIASASDWQIQLPNGLIIVKQVALAEWRIVKAVVKSTGTFDVYIDGILKLSGQPAINEPGGSTATVNVTTSAASIVWVDDVCIYQYK